MTPGDRSSIERFAVGGWIDAPRHVNAERLLLLGEEDGSFLTYVGHVRLPPVQHLASRLGTGMEGLEVERCPFVDPPQEDEAHWCRSGLAVTVRFDGRNALGRLRMPSLQTSRPVLTLDDAAPGGGRVVPHALARTSRMVQD